MGVLEKFRSGSDSTFMQVVIAAVAVSFVFMLSRPDAAQSRAVAVVDGVKIMDTDFGRQYRNELRRTEASAGRTLSDAEQKQLGERVKQQLIEGEVLLQEADRLGLTISGDEIARALLDIGGVRDEEGRFDETAYLRMLKQQQYTRDGFEEMIRKDLLRQKLRFMAFMGASLSEPSLKEAWQEQETRVDIEFVSMRPQSFEADVAITPEQRTTWLTENEALVREAYDRDFDRLYNHPEMVDLWMIRLGVTGEGPGVADLLPILNKLRADIEAGADFAEMARRWSEDPSALSGGNLGTRSVPQLGTETVDALTGLQPGQVSRVVTSDTDLRLYKLVKREAPRVEAFEDVSQSIADSLIAKEQTPALAASFAEEQLLKAWAESGDLPEALIQSKGLVSSSTGPVPPMAQGNPFAPPQAMFDRARKAKPGTVFPEVFENNGILFVGKLVDRNDPDQADFEAAREGLREPLLGYRRSEFYTAWVADVKAQATIQ